MTKTEFSLLASTGTIERVTLFRYRHVAGWEVWAYGDNWPANGTCNRVMAARGNARRWATLDRAHAWIRKQGFAGNISIDG